MRALRFIAYLTVAVFAATAHAEKSTDGDEELLPIYETPAEKRIAQMLVPIVTVDDPPPVAPIRNIAEYEPCTGVLIRYPLGIGYGLIREMAEDVIIHCVVSSANKNTAIQNFQDNNIPLNKVQWVIEPSNSIWTRDYGPWFVFDGNGDQVILDHFYNRTARPDDNVIPIALGELWNIPVVTHALWHAGGNYMTEGHGSSFSSDLVWNENWEMTHQEIADFFYDYYGVDTYNVLPDIQLDGIHHIDCWAKFLDEETVLVKKVASNHTDYNRIENAAATIASLPNKYGRLFKVLRITCPPIQSGNVAAFTNSLILNKKVLVPAFGIAGDATAIQTYQAALPGYEVLSFTGGWLTDDALHCRVMQIHDRYMLRVDHNPLQGSPAGVPMEVNVYLDDRSEAGLDMAQCKLYWRQVGAPSFTPVSLQLAGEPDWYRAQIAAQAPGAQIEYYISARDDTGRIQTRPRTAPVATYKVNVDAQTGVKPPRPAAMTLVVGPSPFRFQTVARFSVDRDGGASVNVYDVRGRLVTTLVDRQLSAGDQQVSWNGRDANGAEAPSGVYFVVLKSAGEKITRRVVLLR